MLMPEQPRGDVVGSGAIDLEGSILDMAGVLGKLVRAGIIHASTGPGDRPCCLPIA